MRLLFLGLAYPLPANNGLKMRSWATLRALAAEGHETTLLSFAKPEEVSEAPSLTGQVCREVDLIPMVLSSLSASKSYLHRFLALCSATPFAVRRLASKAMRQRVRHHLEGGIFDAAICDTTYSAVNLPATRVPIVINCHNLEHRILQRYAALERNPLKKLYAWSEAMKLRRWEQHVLQGAAVGMACSEHDRELLQTLAPDLRLAVVPNIVDTDTYQPQAEGDSRTVIYQGGMDWFPNRDAVNYFVQEILPLVRREAGGVRFVVAGRNPSEAFRKRYAGVPNMEFTGTVPDMQPVIARATVCVVPLRMGSGTRLKILEAAAMGKPVVSTRLGAEGLDLEDGREILLADEPREFARAVCELLSNPQRRRALGKAARKKVEEMYSLVSLRRAIRAALQGISGGDSPGNPEQAASIRDGRALA
jgi:glycosyltransferase involved in cell wall biosynthesis